MPNNTLKAIIFVVTATLFSHPVMAKVDCEALAGKSYEASITKVADGDTATVRVLGFKKHIKVRFYGVDTPESEWKDVWPAQPYSSQAKSFTVSKLRGKEVTVSFTGDGTYTRCVGEVFLNGKSHSLSLIENGYGWWYEKYAPNRSDLKNAHYTAKRSKVGLWANSNAQAPWDFRFKYRN